jgi:hypothetical protein
MSLSFTVLSSCLHRGYFLLATCGMLPYYATRGIIAETVREFP